MADMGYLVELNSLRFNDADRTSWIQAFPYGKYDHPVYGEIEFDPAKAADAAQNFATNVRGTEIDVDYDHKAHGSEAAGWIRKAEARTNGFWIMVEWTKKAYEHIKNDEYKYFSPEFADEWKHPKTGQVVKNILFGGGITNRPFLKDILPLNMSELGMASERPQEGSSMDPEKIRELLGLPKDATDEQVETALKERKPEEVPEEVATPPETEAIAASEVLPMEVIQLAESNPLVKSLVEHVTALGTSLHQTQTALRLSEVNGVVKQLTEGTSGQILPASVQGELTDVLLATDAATGAKIVKILSDLKQSGLVQLGEIGHGGGAGTGDGQDVAKKFNESVQKIVQNDKLSYADAVERAASLDPQLYDEYRASVYSFTI